MQKVFLLFVTLLIIQGCSIEKRQYLGGYHITKKGDLVTHQVTESKATRAPAKIEKAELTLKSSKNEVEPIKNIQPETNTAAAKPTTAKPAKKLSNSKPSLKIKLLESQKASASHLQRGTEKNTTDDDVPFWVIVLLCFILPPLAVGFATNWEITPILINFLLCLLCGIPGIVHALIVVLGKRK